MAVDKGLCDEETGSLALGFNEGVVKKAKKDHAERVARIAASQGVLPGARGVPDLTANRTEGAAERKTATSTDTEDTTEKPVRGEGRD
jgi:hypothetical protein